MLLIGDIHINAQYADRILSQLESYTAANPREKTVVFLGDYVYHFSYHRGSLLRLFALFLTLWQEGRDVYVLAGNHDWLGDSFVFAEAQKLLQVRGTRGKGQGERDEGIDLCRDAIHRVGNKGSLTLITEPLLMEIEDKEVLFLPSMIQIRDEGRGTRGAVNGMRNGSIEQKIAEDCHRLLASNNKYERLSGQINLFVLEAVQTKKNKLTVVHHRYWADTVLPGQKGSFSFAQGALHPLFLEMSGVSFLAGHTHSACSYKNFLCTGSVWSTSPLEVNQQKYVFSVQPDGSTKATPLFVNPYLSCPVQEGKKVGINEMQTAWQESVAQQEAKFQSPLWQTEFIAGIPDWAWVTLQLQVDTSYTEMQSLVSSEVYDVCRAVQLQKHRQLQDAMQDLTLQGKQLGSSLADWKTLLLDHLRQKYGDEHQKYLAVLQEVKLL